MKRFHLAIKPNNTSLPCADIMLECIVDAKNQEQARYLAASAAGDEGGKIWVSKRKTSCVEISALSDEPTVIMRNFKGV